MGAVKRAKSSTADSIDRLLAVAPDAMIIIGADGRVAHVNTQAQKLLGYSQDQLRGQKADLLIPRLRRHRNGKDRAGQVARPKIHTFGHGLEVLVRRSDGTEFPAVINLGLLEVGPDTLISSAIRQIPPGAGEELSLRALVDASDDAIIGKTLDGIIVSWNKGAEKIYGYKAEEILGHPISVLIPAGRRSEFPEIMKRLRCGEHIEKYENTRTHKDGHPIDISVTISPVKNKAGLVVGASVVARDITEQKQAQNALRQSEERFRVALKSAPVVVSSQDLQLRYTWFNSPYLFRSEEDLLGRTDADVFDGEEGARLTAIKKEALRTGTESHSEVTVTVKGVKHHFDLVVEPLRDPKGKLLGVLCSAIETTYLKETIVKLQDALNEVQLLKGLLHICANCKRIKDEEEQWQVLEVYLQAHSEAKFTHGLCPDCLRKLYPEYCR